MFRFILLLVSLFLTSCADFRPPPKPPPQVAVTYASDPPGAVLYYNGVRQGYTPITLYYDITQEMRAKGVNLPANVRWQSGATAEIKLFIDLARGQSFNWTFQRPNNISGREADEQFGLQTESMRQQKESQEQQQLQTIELQLQTIELQQNQQLHQIGVGIGGLLGGGSGQAVQPPPVSNSINCTSRALGGQVFTNCN